MNLLYILQDLLMLLDLLGAAKPTFYNYFAETEGWYNQLVDIESRLGAAGQLVEHAHNSAAAQHKKRNQGYFQPYSIRMHIEDDHIPFLKRDVIQMTFFFILFVHKCEPIFSFSTFTRFQLYT